MSIVLRGVVKVQRLVDVELQRSKIVDGPTRFGTPSWLTSSSTTGRSRVADAEMTFHPKCAQPLPRRRYRCRGRYSDGEGRGEVARPAQRNLPSTASHHLRPSAEAHAHSKTMHSYGLSFSFHSISCGRIYVFEIG